MNRLKPRHPASLLPSLLLLCCLNAVGGSATPELIRIGGTGSGTLLLQRLGEAYGNQHPGVQIKAMQPSLGGNGALRALAANAIDLAVVSLPPQQGDALSSSSWLWVRTPLVLVANSSQTGNGLPRGLSREQVAAIFAGHQHHWPDGTPVRLVLRSQRESDLKLLRAISPEIDIAVGLALKRPGLPVAENDIENQQLLEQTPGAFGVITLGQLLLSASRLTPLPMDGIPPSIANLRSRSYPYEKPLYLVAGSQASAATRGFLSYLQSPAAQEALARLGFIAPPP